MHLVLSARGLGPQRAQDCGKSISPGTGLPLQDELNPDQLRQSYKNLVATRALAGTGSDAHNTRHIKEQWKAFGLHDSYSTLYDALLFYLESPNKVTLVDGSGEISRISAKDVDLLSNFVAYSVNATTEGSLVFAHYGR